MAVALAFVATTPAWSNPQGGVAIAGSATMASNGNQLVVTTQNAAGQNYSAINWQSFSIPSGSSTYFQQPNAASTVINRVVTSTPSLIYGTLGSNGNLVLVNQSGITVGAGAVVDTAGFTASALRMSDADALAGRLHFGDSSSSTGAVSVQGTVLARQGDVVLLGASVDTGSNALVQAPNGSVVLAAGQQVDITGRGLEGIVLRVQAPTDSVVNLGTLGGDAVGLFASTLHHSGDIQATAVSVEGGKVVLKAAQSAQVDGSISAKALNNVGGSVMVTANQVDLGSTAVVDVSGASGGGEALIGGGFHGQDTRISNAQQTTVAAGAQIRANATVSGNGGNIVVWSDGSTAVHGNLSARGAGSGNGGNLETSGHTLDVSGITVSAAASAGKAGTWLLDPDDIVVDSTVVNATLGTGTNVSVQTSTGDITINNAITGSAQPATLTLNSGNGVIFNAGVSASGAPLSLVVTAVNNVVLGSSGDVSLSTGGGNVSLTSTAGSITGYGASSITTGGGNVVIQAAGNITGLSGITTSGNFAFNGTAGSAGSINLTASSGYININNLTANGGFIAGTTGNGGNAGNISITEGSCIDCSNSIGTISATGGSAGYGSGVVGGAGDIAIVANQPLSMSNIAGHALSYTNQSEGIDFTNTSLSLTAMQLSAAGNIVVNTSGLSQFGATTTGAGGSVNLANNSTSNIGALEIVGITALNGDAVISNYGALTTTGAIKADGMVSLTAHSPITIGTGGISAGGNVSLAANTTSAQSNITLNGVVQSAAAVNISAYSNITQNSLVSGAAGVSASSTGGTITFGANGYSAGSPLTYTDIHGAVTVPLVPASSLVPVFDPSTVLDLLVASNDTGSGSVFTDNPFAPDNRKKSDLVMEGQLCTP